MFFIIDYLMNSRNIIRAEFTLYEFTFIFKSVLKF